MHGIWNLSDTIYLAQLLGHRLGKQGIVVQFLEETRDYISVWNSPANLLFNDEQGALSPWAKWLGHEADHSPHSNAK